MSPSLVLCTLFSGRERFLEEMRLSDCDFCLETAKASTTQDVHEVNVVKEVMLAQEPVLVETIVGQDWAKILLIAFLLLGNVMSTAMGSADHF